MTGREIAAMFMLGTVVEVISRPIYAFLSKKIEDGDSSGSLHQRSIRTEIDIIA